MHKLNSAKCYWKSTPVVHLQAVELLSVTLQKQTGNSAGHTVIVAQEGNSLSLTTCQFCTSKRLFLFCIFFHYSASAGHCRRKDLGYSPRNS